MTSIRTVHVQPPIPTKKWDWCAYDDNYEPGAAIGWGETEQEAVNDFIESVTDSEWRGDVLWWKVGDEWIADPELRNWCHHNMGESVNRHVDVVRMCHLRAFYERRADNQTPS